MKKQTFRVRLDSLVIALLSILICLAGFAQTAEKLYRKSELQSSTVVTSLLEE
jgi:hypothetical protein